jgi:hypothetical protein
LLLREANVTHILRRLGGEVNAFAGDYVSVEAVREELVRPAYVKDGIGIDADVAQTEQVQTEFHLADVVLGNIAGNWRAIRRAFLLKKDG